MAWKWLVFAENASCFLRDVEVTSCISPVSVTGSHLGYGDPGLVTSSSQHCSATLASVANPQHCAVEKKLCCIWPFVSELIFFENCFTEVQPTHNKLHKCKVNALVSLDVCIHPCKGHCFPDSECEPIHRPNFSCALCSPLPSLLRQ